MNFSPHHGFSSCRTLEQTVARLKEQNGISDVLYRAHENYHYSLIHKLRTAQYHVDNLAQFLETDAAKSLRPTDLVYRVNFYFDGFLYSVGSALDIFAREVLTYFGEAIPNRTYYWTAHRRLSTQRPGDPILSLIGATPWIIELKDYRNTSTHESLIGTTYTVQYGVHGAAHSSRLIFPIPDDPRNPTGSARRNPDIVNYCCTSFKRVLRLANQAYGHIEGRARAAGMLPL